MNKKLNKKGLALRDSKGFTLIEVVLAIAIGALIFLLAFVAFRNAQVNRRDSQRRSDVDKIAAEINNYASDHNGNVPSKTAFFDSASSGFLKSYVNTLTDPSDNSTTYVTINVTNSNGTTTDNASDLKTTFGSINYASRTGAGTESPLACDGTTTLTAKNSYVVKMRLEKGIACRDSATN